MAELIDVVNEIKLINKKLDMMLPTNIVEAINPAAAAEKVLITKEEIKEK